MMKRILAALLLVCMLAPGLALGEVDTSGLKEYVGICYKWGEFGDRAWYAVQGRDEPFPDATDVARMIVMSASVEETKFAFILPEEAGDPADYVGMTVRLWVDEAQWPEGAVYARAEKAEIAGRSVYGKIGEFTEDRITLTEFMYTGDFPTEYVVNEKTNLLVWEGTLEAGHTAEIGFDEDGVALVIMQANG